jgi:hypothetical protein
MAGEIEALAEKLAPALLQAAKAAGKRQPTDDYTIDQVAEKLCKSRRWVFYQIRDKRFQFHHYIGRTPLWTEEEFQKLRQALIAAENEKRGHRVYASSNGTAIGISTAPSGSTAAHSALERVLAFPRSPKHGKPPMTSGSKRKAAPGRKSSTESGQVCRLPLPSKGS